MRIRFPRARISPSDGYWTKPKNSNAVSVVREVEEDQMLGPAGSRSSRETRGIEHDGFCCRRKSQILTSTSAEKHRSNRIIKFDPRSFSDRPRWNH